MHTYMSLVILFYLHTSQRDGCAPKLESNGKRKFVNETLAPGTGQLILTLGTGKLEGHCKERLDHDLEVCIGTAKVN